MPERRTHPSRGTSRRDRRLADRPARRDRTLTPNATPRPSGRGLPRRAPARARRVPELQAPDRGGTRPRPRARRRGSHPQGPDVADDFDRAIEARPAVDRRRPWFEGIAAIDRKLRVLLESEGVTPIDATPGTAFDPREHEAIATVPGTGRPEGEIVETARRGYRLRDRVLRPALVAVSAAPTTNDIDPTAPLH